MVLLSAINLRIRSIIGKRLNLLERIERPLKVFLLAPNYWYKFKPISKSVPLRCNTAMKRKYFVRIIIEKK